MPELYGDGFTIFLICRPLTLWMPGPATHFQYGVLSQVTISILIQLLETILYSIPLLSVAADYEIHKKKKSGTVLLLTPISRNPEFPPGVKSRLFSRWHSKGIRTIGDLVHDNSVISFQELQTKFDIPKQDHYAFLQIRHYITAKLKSPPDTPSYSEVEKFLVNTKNTAHFISKFYSFILSQSSLSLDNVVHK